jgi:hypothetical protein
MQNHNNENHNQDVNAANPLDKPPVSERKREANRQNAQKSTGPKTEAGKERSSRNAVKHGMWSERDTPLYGEEHQDFLRKLAALREYYQPDGPLEEFEVERIAHMQRRMARATRFENASVSLLQLDAIRWDDLQRRNVEEVVKEVTEIFKKYPKVKPIAIDDVDTSTPPTEVAVPEIDEREQLEDNNQDTEAVSQGDDYQRFKEYLSFVDQGHSRRSEMAKLEKASLPKAEDMNIVLRADSAAEKSLARAIKRLEELQAKRKEREKTYRLDDVDDSDDVITV